MSNEVKYHSLGIGLEPISADPANPSQGQYQESDGTHRSAGLWRYDGTSWVPVGSGAGNLSIIYQEDFESSVKAADLITGQNPVFDTAGTFAGTLEDEETNPLSKRNSIKYTIGGSTNDWFHTNSIVLEEKSVGSTVDVSVHAKFSGANNVVRLVVWDDTNDAEIDDAFIEFAESREYNLIVDLPFNCQAIKVGFHASGTGTSGDELVFDDIQITQQSPAVVEQNRVLILKDNKPSGTAGQLLTPGSWDTRDLNTIDTDEIGISPLSSNQFTLPAGKYRIKAGSQCFQVNQNRIRLRNITDSQDTIVGFSETSPTNGSGNTTNLTGTFTIASSKTFEIQHRISTGNAGGLASSFGIDETYTIVEIFKVE